MTTEIENLPIILIDMRPDLHEFLIHEFGEDEKGRIKLHRRSDIGKYLDSMWLLSEFPVRRKFEKYHNPVKLILPQHENNFYVMKCNFLYFSISREQQVNDYLESIWSLVVREYFITGYEKGFKQSVIIDGILHAYNIKKNCFSTERIKKMDYRIRKNTVKLVVDEIQNSMIQ